MKTIFEVSKPECKISVFSWNGKYLIKFEQPGLEQTYKIDQTDVRGEQDVRRLLEGKFPETTLSLFDQMRENLDRAVGDL